MFSELQINHKNILRFDYAYIFVLEKVNQKSIEEKLQEAEKRRQVSIKPNLDSFKDMPANCF